MRLFFVLSILLTMTITGCCSTPDLTNDRKALEEAIASFYQAIEDGDGKAAIALFDESFIMLPNGGSLKQGRANIAESWAQGVENGFRLRNIKMVDMDFDGAIAYRINQYEWGYPDENGEMQWHPTKNMHIWKKQPDESWKLYADIWNSNHE
ncbi:MAG: nuclear transport factor 2 family protein [candidate division Zixibacteria bacterium]|nr:nuclear transport factor 2 family protein [candidate division Zixibacteria bacterium]